MTLTIELTPEEEAHIRQEATMRGLSEGECARQLLTFALEWKTRDYEETVTALKEAEQAIKEGRVRSFSEFSAEMRRKYGPNMWPDTLPDE